MQRGIKSSFSTSGIRHVSYAKNQLARHERGRGIVTMTNRTYRWSSDAQITYT